MTIWKLPKGKKNVKILLAVLGVKLRALDRQVLYHSNHSARPFFVLVIFETGSCFAPCLALTTLLLLVFPWNNKHVPLCLAFD
jgi:hypothetical protein